MSSASRPSNGTNSVTVDNGSVEGSTEGRPSPDERVNQFIEEYPELAFQEICEREGVKLREELTITNERESAVLPQVPSDDAFMVSEVTERRSVTWAALVQEFLESHLSYEGAQLKFEKEGEEPFFIPLTDAWGKDYADGEYAKAQALQREVSEEWDDLVTVMLTTTASSVPGGERLAPVDHARAIQDAYSYEGVRDALRNTLEYHLGLEPDEYAIWAQDEAHTGDGENACYTHQHIGVFLNIDPERHDLNEVGSEFERVIDKHLEVCEPAGKDAHAYEKYDYVEDSGGPISVNGDVENMGSYMAEYAGNYGGELLERPIEYIAWGAIQWATNSQRSRRSKTANEAIRADACKQKYESDDCAQAHAHGERLTKDGNGNVVCMECGSAWGVPDGDTVVEARLVEADGDGGDDGEESLEEELRGRWPSAKSATVVTSSGEVGPYSEDAVASFERSPEWRVTAVVKGGEEYPVSSSSGGVEMVELQLPSEHEPPPEFPVNGYGPGR